jgi:hypothetical protein
MQAEMPLLKMPTLEQRKRRESAYNSETPFVSNKPKLPPIIHIPPEFQDPRTCALLVNPVFSLDKHKFFNESSYHAAWLAKERTISGRDLLPDWYRKNWPLRDRVLAWAKRNLIDIEVEMTRENEEVDRMKMLCFQEHRVNSPLPGYCMASD